MAINPKPRNVSVSQMKRKRELNEASQFDDEIGSPLKRQCKGILDSGSRNSSPASPQARRARGEVIQLPRSGFNFFKPTGKFRFSGDTSNGL